ncbi:MAG: PLD nuclease N-terminal domain-containing protein [Actinomycetota bacterium]|nr:PLD nuclease N-terminal domain-containing protein [Actinomycetota bacterium]
MAKKKWADFTRTQQRVILAASAVELVLTSIALVDLASRRSSEVRGSKALWLLGVFVQPVGPIAYLSLGRLAKDER